MDVDTSLSPRSGLGGGHEPRVSWKDVLCAWGAVLAVGLLGLLL